MSFQMRPGKGNLTWRQLVLLIDTIFARNRFGWFIFCYELRRWVSTPKKRSRCSKCRSRLDLRRGNLRYLYRDTIVVGDGCFFFLSSVHEHQVGDGGDGRGGRGVRSGQSGQEFEPTVRRLAVRHRQVLARHLPRLLRLLPPHVLGHLPAHLRRGRREPRTPPAQQLVNTAQQQQQQQQQQQKDENRS